MDFPIPYVDREREYEKYYEYYSQHYDLRVNS